MICPVIHPNPCPDPEACQTGYPCAMVLAFHTEPPEGIGGNSGVISHVKLIDYGPNLHPLLPMEGQIELKED